MKEDKDFIVMKYNAEMVLNRISHGYDPQELFLLIGHFCTAPLAVITHSGKHCVIVDYSFPRITTCINLDESPQDRNKKYVFDPTQTSIYVYGH